MMVRRRPRITNDHDPTHREPAARASGSPVFLPTQAAWDAKRIAHRLNSERKPWTTFLFLRVLFRSQDGYVVRNAPAYRVVP
jgi:hypothetical protein